MQRNPLRRGGLIMGNDIILNLVDVSWPISILKCNRQVDEMLPGDQMTVILADADTMDNLAMLLRTMPNVGFCICEKDDCFVMDIQKRSAS